MRRKKVRTGHIVMGIILIFMLVLTIFSSTLNNKKKLNKFEALIKDATTSVEKVLFYPFNYIAFKIDDYKELKDVQKKYKVLLNNVERIDSLNAENMELRKQLDAMKSELKIENVLTDYEYLNATVISRNVAYWYNTITIDKGSHSGIKEDMVVVNSKGLIGKVVNTTLFTSDIRLLTTGDTINKISITINDGNNSVNGLIKNYNYNTGFLEVEGISNTEKVVKDAKVYTSGLGGIFPSGILIGKVVNVKTDEYDLAKLIDVEPIVDFNDINYVAVLKRKEISK